MIDTHTHIYLQEFDEDRRAVIDRAEKSGITRMILPNVDVETVGALRQTLNDYSSLCKGAMGLHPTSINQDYKRDLSCIEAELDRGEYCAVGEIGMDLYWDKTFLREQIDAFTSQVRWSCNKKIPVIICCGIKISFVVIVDRCFSQFWRDSRSSKDNSGIGRFLFRYQWCSDF